MTRVSPLLRKRASTVRWYLTHPWLVRGLVSLAVVSTATFGANTVVQAWNQRPAATQSPAPTVVITISAPTPSRPPSAPVGQTPTGKPSPEPVKTVTVKPSPTQTKTVTVKPKPGGTSGSGSKTISYSKTLTCAYQAVITARGSGQGRVATKITGPSSGSGTTSVTVSGGPGNYVLTVTDTGGHPRLTYTYDGCI